MMYFSKVAGRRIDVTLFAVFTLALAFLPFAYHAYEPLLEVNELVRSTPRADYLASLRDRTLVGCLLMKETRPDILVLGDSHSYADIDYEELERRVAPTRVGHCAVGAAFLETFDQWLTYFESSGYRPKQIVFGSSVRMFMNSPTKATRRAITNNILFDNSYKSRELARWISERAQGRPAFGTSAALKQAWLTQNAPKIAALSPQVIDATLHASRVQYLLSWKGVGKGAFSPGSRELIDKICVRLVKMGIKLSVVHLPISPYGWSAYTDKQKAEYADILGYFSRCASPIIIPKSEEIGIDSRSFVNRPMLDDYDYGIWDGKPHEFGEKAHYVFDVDHMNPVGAQIFTKWLADRLFAATAP